MKLQYVSPDTIHVAAVLNNREVNQNYIADLAESMRDKGFLPEFPIDVFKSENLANIDTDLPYVCACGAHRTLAAINAKLDVVLVRIHEGREEAFIETMHLDNFKFDPALNSNIGQPFTQKEKRNAVTQLLLLPKYFEMTNTALEEIWRIPSSSIRRWRAEVVTMLETDSLQLRHWGISDGRLARIRELVKSPERKNEDGKVVKIRRPLAEVTNDEKREFYEQIESDWKQVCDIDVAYLQYYLQEAYNLRSRYRQYDDLSMPQLRKLHKSILSEDDELFDAVLAIEEKGEEEAKARDAFQNAHKSFVRQFKKTLAPGMNEYSPEYTQIVKDFEKHLANFDEYKFVRVSYYDYDYDQREDFEFMTTQAEMLVEITDGIKKKDDSIADFIKNVEIRNKRRRNKAEKVWTAHLAALREAIKGYPRNITQDALVSAVEHKYNYQLKHGEFRDLLTTDAPSDRKHLETIKKESGLFEKVAKAVKNDEDWVKDIPVLKPLIESIPEPDVEVPEFEITHIYIEVTGRDGKVFHPEGAAFSGDPELKGLKLNEAAIACLSDATIADILSICRHNKFQHYRHHFDIDGPRDDEFSESGIVSFAKAK